MNVELRDVTVTFKNGVCAVNHVNLKFGEGIYGLLGENGAGKTTLMRVLTTVINPSGGEVSVSGVCYKKKNYEQLQKKIGYLPQELTLYPNLTVRECLEYMGGLCGLSKGECKKRMDYYLARTTLLEHQNKKMRQLSGGMKRRVGLIQALIHEPELLIVDEPTTGLDPEERIRIRNLLVDFSKDRMVLFSTHVVEDLAATCSSLSIMKKGNFLYSGTVKELMKKAEGHVWTGIVKDEEEARALERRYHVSSKLYVEEGLKMRIISSVKPEITCKMVESTLEDAYMLVSTTLIK